VKQRFTISEERKKEYKVFSFSYFFRRVLGLKGKHVPVHLTVIAEYRSAVVIATSVIKPLLLVLTSCPSLLKEIQNL